MAGEAVGRALALTEGYLALRYPEDGLAVIRREIRLLTGWETLPPGDPRDRSYGALQGALSCLNEKQPRRRDEGVYYTPSDVVSFILRNTVKLSAGVLEGLSDPGLETLPYAEVCREKTVCDPTCGTGVFLLAALELKLDLLDSLEGEPSGAAILRTADTLRGNDLSGESVAVAKLRLFLEVLRRYGPERIQGLAETLNRRFTCRDFVLDPPEGEGYDVIVGNPPYVEEGKGGGKRYGNLYASVLENAADRLNPGGALGFVIPLSYAATPRMGGLREAMYRRVPEQYVLSFSDRPDCLFSGVHQKLCILLGRNRDTPRRVFTGNYRYWYKEERKQLFETAQVVENPFVTAGYIPKIGTETDGAVYRKILAQPVPLLDALGGGESPLYLNMRAAFWIKAFSQKHDGGEYREFRCRDGDTAALCLCLLNSSLFWWYWICVSDCWHITRKELSGFRIPEAADFREAGRLAAALEAKLEETKAYVGTRQTQYEYKHRACVAEIRQIDGFVRQLYGLTEEEGRYIEQFAYRYRTSGGAADGRH